MTTSDLQTARLTLVPIDPSMLAELHDLFTNPAVRRYLTDDQVVDAAWVNDAIAASQRQFEETNYGLWAIRRAGYRPILGVCGYVVISQLQLLFALLPEHWGQGFATEAANAVVDYGFIRGGMTQIVAATDVPNAASVRVMKRLGMTYQKTQNGIAYYSLRIRHPLAEQRTHASPGLSSHVPTNAYGQPLPAQGVRLSFYYLTKQS